MGLNNYYSLRFGWWEYAIIWKNASLLGVDMLVLAE